MLRVEYNNIEGKYYFLYVTDEVRISTTEPHSFNLEYKDGCTVQVHNVWTYLNPTKDAFFALRVLTEFSDEVMNAVKVLKACGGCYED
jgi:hypothetical protein